MKNKLNFKKIFPLIIAVMLIGAMFAIHASADTPADSCQNYGHSLNDETYKCTVCGESFFLTIEEAIALGQTFEKGTYSDDVYYVQLTANVNVNINGFVRTKIGDDLYFSAQGGYINFGDGYSILKCDTVVLKGNIGSANSNMVSHGKESRLFNVTFVKFVEREAHDYSGDFVVETPSICTNVGSGYVSCICGYRNYVEIPIDPNAHVYENRLARAWGICMECGYVDENHEHILTNGKCNFCDYVYETYEVLSTFDNDADGVWDMFYFSHALPEEFNIGSIKLDAFVNSSGTHMEYDEVRAGYENPLPYPHVYCSDQVVTDSIEFTVSVTEAGLYNVAVHYRIKDQLIRGAKFIINEGTEYEQVINHTYGFLTEDDVYEVRNNDFLLGSYMTGLAFELQEGRNTITIRVADGVAKSQHFRNLYLVKAMDFPETPEETTPEMPEETTPETPEETTPELPNEPEKPQYPNRPVHPDVDSSTILGVATEVSYAITDCIGSAMSVFYFNGALTLIGVLSLIGIGFSFMLLIILIIKRHLDLRR